MKKLALTLGLACLFMVACNNTPKQEEAVEPETPVVEAVEEQHECPMAALKAEFENWDNMAEEAKAELVNKAVTVFEEMEANRPEKPEMGPEGKPCCKPEMMKSCCDKCVEGCCKEGKCICENCPCECMKDGKCTMEEGKPCCKPEMPELTEEMKAEMETKMAEMKAKWDNFANMTLDEQKDLILERLNGCKGDKPCCKAEEPAETPAE